MLGRLKSLPKSSERNYYCYSAGCLGVVATLSNITEEKVIEIAFDVQQQWLNGELSRFELTQAFVDKLVPPNTYFTSEFTKIKIITTTSSSIARSHIRTPETSTDLREMLVQTCWIPFVTGWGLGSKGHLDGAFSQYIWPLPRYDIHLKLPRKMDVILNVMNPNLSIEQTLKFFHAGTLHGLNENVDVC